ncbi:uncharacterized protein ACB058_002291 [Synchiropus picturatus]
MGFWNSKPAETNTTTVKNTSTETPTRTHITRTPTSHAAEEKCYEGKDPNLKFVEREDEMDVLCVGYKSPRALMSCGHSVTPMSLTSYCRHLLEEGRSRFVCAVCEEEWSFQEVQKMALLTPQEADDFEKMMWENYKEEFEVKSVSSISVLAASHLSGEPTSTTSVSNAQFAVLVELGASSSAGSV